LADATIHLLFIESFRWDKD